MKKGVLSGKGGVEVPGTWLAMSWWDRLRGLLFRAPLAPDGSEAMVLIPCNSIHTVGMTYCLDVVFLDQSRCVIGISRNVRPWRIRAHRQAHSVVELHGGAADRLGISVGNELCWQAGASELESYGPAGHHGGSG